MQRPKAHEPRSKLNCPSVSLGAQRAMVLSAEPEIILVPPGCTLRDQIAAACASEISHTSAALASPKTCRLPDWQRDSTHVGT